MKLTPKLKCLILDNKAGFRNVTGKRVSILDQNFQPFYDTGYLDNKVWEFNLPAGVYYIEEGKIVQTPRAFAYKLESLPPKSRYLREDPETFPIIYENNKYTASVYWDAERSPYGKAVIVFDHSMKDQPIPTATFILYHEYAHRFWDYTPGEEKACDMWASNRMLEEGFNPSQIGLAIINTLSDSNTHRKESLINSLIGK